MLMAGLDGIQNKIHPGEPMDKDLYELPEMNYKIFLQLRSLKKLDALKKICLS